VFADAWLSDWLAEISADLRENGSALEVVLHDYALYKSTFTYFTLPDSVFSANTINTFKNRLDKVPKILDVNKNSQKRP